MKLVIDDKIPYIRGWAERLGEAVYLPGAAIGPADVRQADALIVRTRTHCGPALLEGSRVRFVATATIGFDHLDTGYLRRAGIGWANCPGCNAGSVAQYVRNSLLLLEAEGRLRLEGCRVGVVGVGHVGSRVAAELRRWGCRLLLCDPPRLEGAVRMPAAVEAAAPAAACTATLSDVAREADVVTFHTPLTRTGRYATYHLAGPDFFRALGRRPVIINASRGEVVATEALRAALAGGLVRAAVVDTWENEPGIDRGLLAAAYIATPHIAGYSADGKATGTRMALEAVAARFGRDAHFDIRPPRLPRGFRYNPAAAPPAALGPEAAECIRLYDPRRDSDALRAAPGRFEQLRGDYPLRREADV